MDHLTVLHLLQCTGSWANLNHFRAILAGLSLHRNRWWKSMWPIHIAQPWDSHLQNKESFSYTHMSSIRWPRLADGLGTSEHPKSLIMWMLFVNYIFLSLAGKGRLGKLPRQKTRTGNLELCHAMQTRVTPSWLATHQTKSLVSEWLINSCW